MAKTCDEGHGTVEVNGERVCPICDDVSVYMEDETSSKSSPADAGSDMEDDDG